MPVERKMKADKQGMLEFLESQRAQKRAEGNDEKLTLRQRREAYAYADGLAYAIAAIRDWVEPELSPSEEENPKGNK